MGEAVVYKHATRQGEYLGLVLQTAKGCGEDETVVVALEFGAVVFLADVLVFLPEPLIGDKLLPIHGVIYNLTMYNVQLIV